MLKDVVQRANLYCNWTNRITYVIVNEYVFS